MNINPSWNIDEIKNCNYKEATIESEYLQKYIDSGHNRLQIKIFNCFEDNYIPESLLNVKQYFDWKDCAVAINYLKPGTYLPLHSDLYNKYKNVFNVNDTEKIQRAIVMLEDCIFGQFLQIENNIINDWSAGDVFYWRGKTPHATYNFSTKDRYALQITGWT